MISKSAVGAHHAQPMNVQWCYKDSAKAKFLRCRIAAEAMHLQHHFKAAGADCYVNCTKMLDGHGECEACVLAAEMVPYTEHVMEFVALVVMRDKIDGDHTRIGGPFQRWLKRLIVPHDSMFKILETGSMRRQLQTHDLILRNEGGAVYISFSDLPTEVMDRTQMAAFTFALSRIGYRADQTAAHNERFRSERLQHVAQWRAGQGATIVSLPKAHPDLMEMIMPEPLKQPQIELPAHPVSATVAKLTRMLEPPDEMRPDPIEVAPLDRADSTASARPEAESTEILSARAEREAKRVAVMRSAKLKAEMAMRGIRRIA